MLYYPHFASGSTKSSHKITRSTRFAVCFTGCQCFNRFISEDAKTHQHNAVTFFYLILVTWICANGHLFLAQVNRATCKFTGVNFSFFMHLSDLLSGKTHKSICKGVKAGVDRALPGQRPIFVSAGCNCVNSLQRNQPADYHGNCQS